VCRGNALLSSVLRVASQYKKYLKIQVHTNSNQGPNLERSGADKLTKNILRTKHIIKHL